MRRPDPIRAIGAGFCNSFRPMRHYTGMSTLSLFPIAAFVAGLLSFATPVAGQNTQPCVPTGPVLDSELEGDLGPAPAGAFVELTCLEVRNDLLVERRGEVAWSGIPLPRSLALTATDELVLIGAGDRRIAAQFDVLSRWGGPVDDASLPIRWLQVSLAARVDADSTSTYSLRRHGALAAPADPFSAMIAPDGGDFRVDTGLATFVLDPQNPALFESIAIDFDDDGVGGATVYSHVPGAGPKLVFQGGAGNVELDTRNPAHVSVDPGGFEIVEAGPVQVVVKLKGHFSDPGGESLCIGDFPTPTYERFGYTLTATFARGSRDIGLQYNFRNECSNAFSDPFTDEFASVSQASWELPFPLAGPTSHYYAGSGPVTGSAAGFGGVTVVEQAKGGGNPWMRRARVVQGGGVQANAVEFAAPVVALADPTLIVAVQMSWMRYREPQALVADGTTLSLRVVSESLIVGEGKGIWNFARVNLVPAQLAVQAGSVEAVLEAVRGRNLAQLERGLMVRPQLEHINASRIYASLGTDANSLVKSEYLNVMDALHDETVRDVDGQWHRAKTFGSQLWPDVPADLYLIDNDRPEDNNGAMNYWNPSGAELFEFLRSGDPSWVWDFALPQSWLQMFTAYLNIGDHDHGNRGGHAVTSGGTGEGQWHRSAFGSDDYTYNMGMELAYALRPSPSLRDRFAQAGRTVVLRYDIPKADEIFREEFVSQVDITRQVIQHFIMLANCAEFVPGAQGQQCHDKLMELLVELGEDNLRAGIMCQGDVPAANSCFTPQQFMQNSLIYGFFHRTYLNYGDPSPSGSIARALVEAPLNLYAFGLEKQADGESLVAQGDWAAAMECDLTAGGTEVDSCQPSPDSDNNFFMYAPTLPHTAALLLMAHELDPGIELCEIVQEVYEDPDLFAGWGEFLGNESGWWKGAAQMMQSVVFGVGLYDTCDTMPVPEPSSALLALSAFGTLGLLARRRRA